MGLQKTLVTSVTQLLGWFIKIDVVIYNFWVETSIKICFQTCELQTRIIITRMYSYNINILLRKTFQIT
jgi:hypothetical protein